MPNNSKKTNRFMSAGIMVLALVGAWFFKEKLSQEKKLSEVQVLKVAQATTAQGCVGSLCSCSCGGLCGCASGTCAGCAGCAASGCGC